MFKLKDQALWNITVMQIDAEKNDVYTIASIRLADEWLKKIHQLCASMPNADENVIVNQALADVDSAAPRQMVNKAGSLISVHVEDGEKLYHMIYE